MSETPATEMARLGRFGDRAVRDEPSNVAASGLNFDGASLLALSSIVNYSVPSLALKRARAAIAFTGLVRTLVSRR